MVVLTNGLWRMCYKYINYYKYVLLYYKYLLLHLVCNYSMK